MTFKRITLHTPDPEALAKFLCDVLLHQPVPNTSPPVVVRGGAEVALIRGGPHNPPVVLSIMTDAWVKMTDACKAAGATPLETLGGDDHRSAFFRLPGGLLLEVVRRSRRARGHCGRQRGEGR